MNRLRVGLLAGFVVLVSAFTSYLAVTTASIVKFGPFYASNNAFVGVSGGQVGGRVQYYAAGDSVAIGDVVYIATADSVKRSATLANYNKLAGVVVGGTRTGGSAASIAAADVGTLAATQGQTAYVLKQGRTWVANDANATLTAGALIQPSVTTAGKVVVQAAIIDSLYRNVGRVPVGGLASTSVLADISIK